MTGQPCPACGGTGALDIPEDRASFGIGYMGTYCQTCRGTGRVDAIMVSRAPEVPEPCADCPDPDRPYDVPERETLRVPEYRRPAYRQAGGIKFALAVGSIPALPDALEVTIEEWGEPMADLAIGRREADALARYLARWLGHGIPGPEDTAEARHGRPTGS